MAGNKSSIRMI